MKHLLKLSAVAMVATAATASAATYNVDGLINASYDGFRSSVVHKQDYNGDMSGSIVAEFDESVSAGGTWEDDGDISFSGSLENGSYKYSASGNIDSSGGGFLSIMFSTVYHAVTYVFNFDGDLAMGPANSFADGVINLWGDTGTCSHSYSSYRQSHCYGIDLRIAVTETPSEVPLPASALLLLGGVGAFAGLRRKKNS